MRRLASCLLAVLAGPGCLVASLHPAYDKASIRYDSTLAGAWEDDDRQYSLVIEGGPWQSYRVTVIAQSRETSLVGYELGIGSARFIDLTPEHGLEAGPLLVPTHAIAQLVASGDRLELRPLDYDWFRKALSGTGAKGLSAVVDERENVLITSAAPEFRAWLAAHHARDDVLGPPIRFTRRR
jgi:hypothetical protein